MNFGTCELCGATKCGCSFCLATNAGHMVCSRCARKHKMSHNGLTGEVPERVSEKVPTVTQVAVIDGDW